MKRRIFKISLLLIVLLFAVSIVSAHGADLTEDTMIIANESNGIMAKSIMDDNNLDIKVYKFVSEGDVEHQLEHALSNPNKRILAISYQDTVNKYIDEHPELKDRVIVSQDDNASVLDNAQKLLAIDVSQSDSGDFITPMIVGVVIGAIIGLIVGVVIMKKKS